MAARWPNDRLRCSTSPFLCGQDATPRVGKVARVPRRRRARWLRTILSPRSCRRGSGVADLEIAREQAALVADSNLTGLPIDETAEQIIPPEQTPMDERSWRATARCCSRN